jgi:tetratricopeptide (TPR) repeat protein
VPLETQIEYASEALERNPAFIDAHLHLTSTYAGLGNIDAALEHLRLALNDIPEQMEYIAGFVAAAMALAAQGGSDRVSALLADHSNAQFVEPVAIALKLMRGEEPMVANEVLEVAKDIRNRFTIPAV